MSWYEIVLLVNGIMFPYMIYKIALKVGYRDGYISCGWETGVWKCISCKSKILIPDKERENCGKKRVS
tara:strand:+ start:143 stop:346 length:204 start_codon:yes stop_codon:yes gene_type:complete